MTPKSPPIQRVTNHRRPKWRRERTAGQRNQAGWQRESPQQRASGIILILVGLFGVIQGIVRLANNDFYVVTHNWVFQFNLTTWGWVHILVGILALGAGIGLFLGQTWARAVAIIVAAFSILANFTWLPYYPIWAILVIAFDLFVIWAVASQTNRN